MATPKHPFAKSARKGIAKAYEEAVFALNIPMTKSDREELKQLLLKAGAILDKY